MKTRRQGKTENTISNDLKKAKQTHTLRANKTKTAETICLRTFNQTKSRKRR